MTKTPEETLIEAADKAEKAIDALAKVAGKLSRLKLGPNEQDEPPAYVIGIPGFLRDKLALAETQFAAAVKQLYGFTLPIVPPRAQQAVAVRPDAVPAPVMPHAAALHPVQNLGHGQQLPPRPIGRLARDANEPGAGEIVVAQPIRSEAAPLNEEGVGFLTNDSRGALIG